MATYSVNFWGSHPDDDNDDCWIGEDFDSKDEALACYHSDAAFHFDPSVTHCEIDGPDINEVRRVRSDKAARAASDDGEWASEFAMQTGMAFGCDGYNDAMGY